MVTCVSLCGTGIVAVVERRAPPYGRGRSNQPAQGAQPSPVRHAVPHINSWNTIIASCCVRAYAAGAIAGSSVRGRDVALGGVLCMVCWPGAARALPPWLTWRTSRTIRADVRSRNRGHLAHAPHNASIAIPRLGPDLDGSSAPRSNQTAKPWRVMREARPAQVCGW